MPAAAIRINGVVGSNLDLPIDTSVALTNQSVGGETTFAWSIVDQPDGTADTLSGSSGPAVSFTPKKEGTYLLRLVVNGTLEDQVVASVRHLKTRIRVPAGSETSESASAPKGWATDVNSILDLLDDTRADSNVIVGQAGEALTRGQVVRLSSSATIKSGLPGQEIVPVWVKAAADTTDNARGVLALADVAVDGGAISSGTLFYARVIGLFQAGAVAGSPALGAQVFLSDTLGGMSTSAGTIRRAVGRIVAANGGSWDIAFAGVGAFDDGAFVPTSRTLQGVSPIAIANVYTAVPLSADRVITFAIAGQANGDLVVRSAGAWTRLAAGTNTHILTMVAGAPTWAAPAASSVTINTTSPLTGGGTGNSFTLGIDETGFVHIAGAETITGVKTFNANLAMATGRKILGDAEVTIEATGSGNRVDVAAGGSVRLRVANTGAVDIGLAGATPSASAGLWVGNNLDIGSVTASLSTYVRAYRFNASDAHEFATTTYDAYYQGDTAWVNYATRAVFQLSGTEKVRIEEGIAVGAGVADPGAGCIAAEVAVSIGTSPADPSALLDCVSVTKGILVPRMTTTQRNAIASPASSLLIFNTTTNRHEWYTGSAWKPLGSGNQLPEYLVGPAGSGPGGSDPPYAHPNDANTQAAADGHHAGNPWAVRVLPGNYSARVLIPSGCFMYGVGESYDIGVLFENGAEYLSSGNQITDVEFAYLSRVYAFTLGGSDPALDVTPTGTASGAILVVDRVQVSGNSATAPAVRVACTADTGVAVYGTFATIYQVNSGSSQPALLVDNTEGNGAQFYASVDTLSAQEHIGNDDQPAAVRVVAGGQCSLQPGATPAAVCSIYGRGEVTGTGSLLTVFPGCSLLVADVTPNVRMFDVAAGGLLKLLGTNILGAGASTDYLFGCSSGAGEVQVGGPYDLIGALSPYKTEAGISINGYYSARDERLQVITGTATIDADTTLAIIVPPDATPFTVTLPDPTGWRNGRKLRVKFTGPTYKQDLDLNPATELDYSSLNYTLEWNDALHLAAYDDRWIILSKHKA